MRHFTFMRFSTAFALSTLALAIACGSSNETIVDGDPSLPASSGGPAGSSGGPSGPDGGPAKNDASTKDASTKDAHVEASTVDAAPGCTDPSCSSELVASDTSLSPVGGPMWYLAVDGTNVYGARSTALRIGWAPKSAAAGVITTYAGLGSGDVLGLAAGGSYVYYTWHSISGSGISRLPATGGTSTPLFAAGSASNIDYANMVLDGNTLYFSSGQSGGGASSARKVDLSTLQVTTLYPASVTITANATHLFWMSSSKLMKAPKDASSAPAQIAFLGTTVPRPILADGSEVFYGYEGGIDISKVGVDAPYTETSLNTSIHVDNAAGPGVDYVDANYLYVHSNRVTSGDNGIYRIPRGGGAATLFARDPNVTSVAGDATHIYWANGDLEIRRKAK